MKKTYIEPECEIIIFSSEDVITTSGLKDLNNYQEDFEEYDSSNFQ
ncbi:MAG: hypothetical protein IJ583_07915 [Firmicutes bacterium]|nr:hypothetical protein [Bacillota bacterium]